MEFLGRLLVPGMRSAQIAAIKNRAANNMNKIHKGPLHSIGFFGSSTSVPGSPSYEAAFDTAKLIAQSGRRVVNGGGPGIMLGATMGAKKVGGKISVVYYRPEMATDFEGSVGKNKGDEIFEEQNYILRTKKLLELSDAFIIFKGGTGTLSEFAMAWGISRLYIGHHKPIVLFGEFWRPIMAALHEHLKIRKEESSLYKIVTTPEQAMEAIGYYEKIIYQRKHEHENCSGTECKLLI